MVDLWADSMNTIPLRHNSTTRDEVTILISWSPCWEERNVEIPVDRWCNLWTTLSSRLQGLAEHTTTRAAQHWEQLPASQLLTLTTVITPVTLNSVRASSKPLDWKIQSYEPSVNYECPRQYCTSTHNTKLIYWPRTEEHPVFVRWLLLIFFS